MERAPGLLVLREMYCEQLGRHTTLQTEIYVIDRFASFNLQGDYSEQNVAILTDSLAVALRSNQKNSKLLWESL